MIRNWKYHAARKEGHYGGFCLLGEMEGVKKKLWESSRDIQVLESVSIVNQNERTCTITTTYTVEGPGGGSGGDGEYKRALIG